MTLDEYKARLHVIMQDYNVVVMEASKAYTDKLVALGSEVEADDAVDSTDFEEMARAETMTFAKNMLKTAVATGGAA